MVKDFCKENRKSVISFCALFALGIVLGIFITINAAGGEFEQIARADMEFGAVKVFFTASFMVLIGYGILLLAAIPAASRRSGSVQSVISSCSTLSFSSTSLEACAIWALEI